MNASTGVNHTGSTQMLIQKSNSKLPHVLIISSHDPMTRYFQNVYNGDCGNLSELISLLLMTSIIFEL